MRPIKDIFIEEYWDVLYRQVDAPEQGVFAYNAKPFEFLGSNSRHWYADTFLFKKDNKIYLFVECVDNVTEIGSIAFSEFLNGKFTKPEIIIKENTHISYPLVFEYDGQIYMMPETHQDKCIQLYKATSFPKKWVKDRIIVDYVDCVDTVLCDGWLISARRCESADMSIDLMLYDFKEGRAHKNNPIVCNSLVSRGAGAVFDLSGKKIRPTQNCTGSVYGRCVNFNEIVRLDPETYEEREIFSFTPENLHTEDEKKLYGVHTYAYLSGIEVVDVKLKRINLKRFFWITRKKLLK